MKKLIFLMIPLFMLLAYLQNGYASSSYISYEVIEIQSEGIVVKNSKGESSFINKNPGDIKVGDIIRYDSIRKRLKKSSWQLAKIIMMNNSTITLQLKNGQNLDVNMRAKYRGDFSEGEEVLFKSSSGQLEKSNFQQIDEE